MQLTQSLVHIFSFITFAAGDNKNYFTSPASNTGVKPVFTLGDQLLVSWVTELGEFNVTFWQQSIVEESAASQGNIYSKIHASDQVTNFTWTVQLLGFDLSYSNEFFLWVNPDGPDGFVSTYFNITEPTTTTTTTATAATATAINTLNLASPVSSSSSSASDSSSASSSSSSETPTPSAGLTTTSKIALGVGVGIGIPVLCALSALIWLKSRKSTNNNSMTEDNPQGSMTGPLPGTRAHWTSMQQQTSPPYQPRDIDPKELQQYRFSSNNRFELPNSPYR